MPSVSKRQQQFMGAELGRKRAGKKTKTKMSEKQLEEYASTKTKGLPDHSKENEMEMDKMRSKHMMPKQHKKMMKKK